LFKQFMQADAMQVCQLDSCRLGGVNEVLAVLLLAAKLPALTATRSGGFPDGASLRRPVPDRQWSVRAARGPRLQHRDAPDFRPGAHV
jgi:hypothetical protein